MKELGRKSWKKLYVCLRRSGLYCSTKGASKVSLKAVTAGRTRLGGFRVNVGFILNCTLGSAQLVTY